MFQKAIPVWAADLTHKDQLNCQLMFCAEIGSLENAQINIAAVDFYRLTANGHFVGFGPARTAKGYARVDSYDLSAYDNQKLYADDTSITGMLKRRRPNEIKIEVAGYHCMTLSTAPVPIPLCRRLSLTGAISRRRRWNINPIAM